MEKRMNYEEIENAVGGWIEQLTERLRAEKEFYQVETVERMIDDGGVATEKVVFRAFMDSVIRYCELVKKDGEID